MRITFIDKVSNITSKSLDYKAIDSNQKKLIFFAKELVKRNHIVTVINQNNDNINQDGIYWTNLKEAKNVSSDLLIAIQDPWLFDNNFDVKKKILWLVGRYPSSDYKDLLLLLLKQDCKIIYDNHFLIDILPHNFRVIPKYFLGNGVSESYFNVIPLRSSDCNALVTTHPLRGLDWLIEIWSKFIHNKIPWAELHVYSKLLSRRGWSKNTKINNLKLKLYTFRNNGIIIKNPLPCNNFLRVLPQYRVHLNPSNYNDTSILTLLESQAAGIPIVSRTSNIIYNSIYDNETGYITDNKEKFSLKTVNLLSDSKLFNQISRNAKLNTNLKSWKEICDNFERFFL